MRDANDGVFGIGGVAHKDFPGGGITILGFGEAGAGLVEGHREIVGTTVGPGTMAVALALAVNARKRGQD